MRVNVPAKLGLYGVGLVALFSASFLIAGAVVPESVVADWTKSSEEHEMAGHDAAPTTAVRGLSLDQDGFRLDDVTAPEAVDAHGTLTFTITGPDGAPVTDFATTHDKKLHLIVVRSDGAHFRHVHPALSSSGSWSLPWTWSAAGTYRVFADFVPTATGENVTVTRAIDVSGDVTLSRPTVTATSDAVDGFDVTVSGKLHAGEESMLTATVRREGKPVTDLRPYLGAFGHLVALRDGDLAYLHVHPEGDAPEAGDRSGPDVEFMTTAPTPGRYLLYLDFNVDGKVHTATFVLDALGPTDSSGQ